MNLFPGIPRRPAFLWIIFSFVIIFTFDALSYAANVTLDEGEEKPKRRFLVFPYPQHTDELGWTIGALAVAQGYIQPQFKFFINAQETGEGRGLIEYDMRDFKIPYAGNRFFLDHSGKFGTYPDPEMRGYTDGNLAFSDERAGTNDSNRENFITSSGTDERFWFRLKYTLPIGDAELSPVKQYVLRDGLLVSGTSGVSQAASISASFTPT